MRYVLMLIIGFAVCVAPGLYISTRSTSPLIVHAAEPDACEPRGKARYIVTESWQQYCVEHGTGYLYVPQ